MTVLCCDNLTDNGRKLEAATIALAEAIDPDTARWIADTVAFPNAMVDSITPPPTTRCVPASRWPPGWKTSGRSSASVSPSG
ncbi:hypothetical protein ACFSLT_08325 [Novosphingobium resinovorum]